MSNEPSVPEKTPKKPEYKKNGWDKLVFSQD
jgi:hypothetical protein